MNAMSWPDIQSLIQQMLYTSITTLELFAFTLLFALPIGLFLCFARMSRIKPLQWITKAYLLVMRGTPLMLQLIFFFFGFKIYGQSLSALGFTRLQVAIIAFSLNYAAYFAEIYRGGIESIPLGQREASNVLGFSKSQTFIHIILPQVIKKILPPMSNEFMTLVKDTSLAQIISVVEISALAKKIQSSSVSILPVVVAGIFYLIMNAVVSMAFSKAEKKLSYYR